MKLLKFNTTNMSSAIRKGEASIRFSRQGQITITKYGVSKIGLKVSDKIALLQDEDNPSDWYLTFDKKEGFSLRETGKSGSLAFNNAAMANALLDSLRLDVSSMGFKLVTEPQTYEGNVKLYTILTAAALKKDKK